MLAGAVGIPPDPHAWTYETKWDGCRTSIIADGSTVAFYSRRGNNVTASYPDLAQPPPTLNGHRLAADGEIVAFDTAGKPSFQLLQRRMHVRRPTAQLVADVPVVLVVFDLLWLDGESLLDLPQSDRRRRLEALAPDGNGWTLSPLLTGDPAALLEACRGQGLEGLVAKRRDALYRPGRRTTAWAKIKCLRRREFLVGGWTEGEGGRQGSIGSLVLGVHDPDNPGGKLRYVGRVGSGLSDDLIAQLRTLFAETAADDCPFETPPPERGEHFVLPLLVVQVDYTGVTADAGVLWQSRLIGVRTDIDPSDVVYDDELRP